MATQYLEQLYDEVPLFKTRLVEEDRVSFSNREEVKCPDSIAALLQEYFADKDREETLLVLLDINKTCIGLSQLSIGGLSEATLEPQQIFKAAILGNADTIALAHNHPSGNPKPSSGDIEVTRQISDAGEVMDVPLVDHLIVTRDEGYTSMARCGYL